MYGYAGKILRLDLTNRRVKIINTSDYEEWGGGHGMGSAIFWDLAVAPGNWDLMDGFDPRNVVTLMVSPLGGTLAPSAGRTEVQGIGVYGYPIGWFTRSGFGGRFAGMLKAAGWDGIVIEGKASLPVWINIINDEVTFEDASELWGLDTWETQQEIWRQVTGNARFGTWLGVGDAYTTQKPAVVAIGPAGENLSRIGSLIHDAGNGAGQGGFGGVFGSKNLKAISVLGTGSVEIADPEELMDARLWLVRQHAYNVDDPLRDAGAVGRMGRGAKLYIEPNRISGCQSCPMPCRRRSQSGTHNDSQCRESAFYTVGNTPQVMLKATDVLQRYGVNAVDAKHGYLHALYEMGVLGPGKEIDSNPVPFDQYGTLGFAEAYLKAISYREGIGGDLAEGTIRAAKKWGRLEEDLDSGLLKFPQWGYYWNFTLPGVEWAYGSLMAEKDITEHDFYFAFTRVLLSHPGLINQLPAEKLVELLAEKTIPYTGDPFMFDYSLGSTGIYSEHKAKQVAWHRHYSRFWKQSILYCDWVFPSFMNEQAPDFIGFTPEAEPRFFNAVTGKNMSFADGMEIGRKIWNLDRAIWILQGRHRDIEKFAGFMYKIPGGSAVQAMPVYKNGKWAYHLLRDMVLDEAGVEGWKTKFYEFEGWDTSSGWPTRATLEGLGLGYVADKLQNQGKLGS